MADKRKSESLFWIPKIDQITGESKINNDRDSKMIEKLKLLFSISSVFLLFNLYSIE